MNNSTTLSEQAQRRRPDSSLLNDYIDIRSRSIDLTKHLTESDVTPQSMPDTSPTKWHLAHTSWFFEQFVLAVYLDGYEPFDANYGKLFNSYYAGAGERYIRANRGLITNPSLSDVLSYRQHVDAYVERLLQHCNDNACFELIELGLHHEQQHQELILTDILHLFSHNPIHPTVFPTMPLEVSCQESLVDEWVRIEGGVVEIGHSGDGFCFDSETPRHQVFLEPFELASRAVTNGQWASFIADGGYDKETLWLSDGWDWKCKSDWRSPLYWQQKEGEWWSFSLRGFQALDMDAPVSHISFFEADAYASWAGARLPTEFEWEWAASMQPVKGNLADSGVFRPRPQPSGQPLDGMFGDVWEWTASSFRPYPRYETLSGTVGEYNGKFMSGQMVLRGGSCVTPANHVRASYRNFFPPQKRWQFSGLRLAKNSIL